MKLLIIKHTAFNKPDCVEFWAKKNQYSIKNVFPFQGEALPCVNTFDFLIVAGGPQSSLEIDKAPYLHDEIKLIKQALEDDKPILGICLGAQLVGEALGAKTELSPHREIGMHKVDLLLDAKDDPIFSQFPKSFDVMHWHDDMFGIAKGAVMLAKSEGCPRQAFRFGKKVYGIQCHFEFTSDIVEVMIEKFGTSLNKSGTYIHSKRELRESNYSEMNFKMETILDYLVNLS